MRHFSLFSCIYDFFVVILQAKLNPSELPHYMSLDEMHDRLTAKIREHYSKRG